MILCRAIFRLWFVAMIIVIVLPPRVESLSAQDSKPAVYSAKVVEKAEKIFADLELKRSGNQIQSTATAEIFRAISGLARKKRELRLVQQQWQTVADKIAAIGQELKRLNAQYGELNLRLAQVAGVDTSANNRIVGLINATNAQKKTLIDQKEQLKQELATNRAALNQAEAEYAETILTIRRDFDAIQKRVEASLRDDQAQIAMRVMHANFDTPEQPTAEMILQSLDKRIERMEQEVFSESIRLDVERGALYVTVVVGNKTARMVVDSGASIVSLPPATAAQLGISVPSDAPEMRLVLADGRGIPAHGVTIPKIRVGEFEAENVEAAVLDVSAAQAEPLLGMSFLGNFKFEIDIAEKTLKLLRVQAE